MYSDQLSAGELPRTPLWELIQHSTDPLAGAEAGGFRYLAPNFFDTLSFDYLKIFLCEPVSFGQLCRST